jgi:hypothetical protein
MRFVKDGELIELRDDIASRAFVHLDGSPVGDVFGGFIRANKSQLYYPLLQDVLILLPDFAIIAVGERKKYADRLMPQATRAVMNFYDRIGWRKTDRGVFHDADINEDFREVSQPYIRACHSRVRNYLPQHGKYLLDVASGPIQYDDYLAYSANFEKRICCDVSFEALRTAASRLGDKGIYIQCDITNLPLKDGVVDGFVSLHTVYHVPGDKQILAFRELERVTRKGGSGVVVYSWGSNSWGTKIGAPWRAVSGLPARVRAGLRSFVPRAWIKWLKRGKAIAPAEIHIPEKYAASQFCFYAHSYGWYRKNIAASGCWSLRVWRSVGVDFLKSYVPDNSLGRVMLVLILAVENLFPSWLGRSGSYPMFIFKKPVIEN